MALILEESFLKMVNAELCRRGYPVQIEDLPDVDFMAYYKPDMGVDEAIRAATELVSDMVGDGDLPDFDDLASVDFDLLD